MPNGWSGIFGRQAARARLFWENCHLCMCRQAFASGSPLRASRTYVTLHGRPHVFRRNAVSARSSHRRTAGPSLIARAFLPISFFLLSPNNVAECPQAKNEGGPKTTINIWAQALERPVGGCSREVWILVESLWLAVCMFCNMGGPNIFHKLSESSPRGPDI